MKIFKKFSILDFIPLLIILIGNVLFLRINTFKGFNAFDMNFAIEGAWRIYCGQIPYVDFIYFNTPLHYYLGALFFKIFGFGKTALFIPLVLVHSLVIVAVFLMARKYLSLFLTILVTALTTSCFYWSVSFPWHDQTAHLFGIVGVASIFLTVPFKSNRWAYIVGFLCGLVSMLSLLAKVNLGVIYGGMLFVMLLAFARRSRAILGFLSGIILGLIVGKILIPQPKEFIEQFLNFYSWDGNKRVAKFWDHTIWFHNYYWVSCVVVLALGIRKVKTHYSWIVLLLATTIISISSYITAAIVIKFYIFLWGVQMAVAFIVLKKFKMFYLGRLDKYVYSIAKWGLVGLTCFLIFVSVQHGLALKVWTYSNRNPFGDYTLKAEPLKGWKFAKFDGFYIDEIVEFVNAYVPREESLYVASDMTILYPLLNRDPFRGIPITHLSPDKYPRPGKELKQVQQNIKNNLPTWIITDFPFYMTVMPYLDLVEEFKACYTIVKSFGPYLLARRICP